MQRFYRRSAERPICMVLFALRTLESSSKGRRVLKQFAPLEESEVLRANRTRTRTRAEGTPNVEMCSVRTTSVLNQLLRQTFVFIWLGVERRGIRSRIR